MLVIISPLGAKSTQQSSSINKSITRRARLETVETHHLRAESSDLFKSLCNSFGMIYPKRSPALRTTQIMIALIVRERAKVYVLARRTDSERVLIVMKMTTHRAVIFNTCLIPGCGCSSLQKLSSGGLPIRDLNATPISTQINRFQSSIVRRYGTPSTVPSIIRCDRQRGCRLPKFVHY